MTSSFPATALSPLARWATLSKLGEPVDISFDPCLVGLLQHLGKHKPGFSLQFALRSKGDVDRIWPMFALWMLDTLCLPYAGGPGTRVYEAIREVAELYRSRKRQDANAANAAADVAYAAADAAYAASPYATSVYATRATRATRAAAHAAHASAYAASASSAYTASDAAAYAAYAASDAAASSAYAASAFAAAFAAYAAADAAASYNRMCDWLLKEFT